MTMIQWSCPISPSFRWGSKPLLQLGCQTWQGMPHLSYPTPSTMDLPSQVMRRRTWAAPHAQICNRSSSAISICAAYRSSRALFALRHALATSAGTCRACLAVRHRCASAEIQEAPNGTCLAHSIAAFSAGVAFLIESDEQWRASLYLNFATLSWSSHSHAWHSTVGVEASSLKVPGQHSKHSVCPKYSTNCPKGQGSQTCWGVLYVPATHAPLWILSRKCGTGKYYPACKSGCNCSTLKLITFSVWMPTVSLSPSLSAAVI